MSVFHEQGGLFAPEAYWRLTHAQKKEICNGGGPRGYGKLVPDTMYGLSLTDAFDIHDYMYWIGGDKAAKKLADELLKTNMYHIIDTQTTKAWGVGKLLRFLRFRRADEYFVMVVIGGKAAFTWK